MISLTPKGKKAEEVKEKDISNKKLREKLVQRDGECNELREHITRLQADFENYQKHVARDKENIIKVANKDLVKDLLDTIDSLESAITSLKEKDVEAAKGLDLIYGNLMKTLKKHGLKEIKAVGRKLDPYYHDVVLQEPSKKEEGTILEELQKGYTLNMNVIRHSKVKTAR
ncbi:MAG: nucleotide exchange factor GrpE [Candidatus Altiarchaeota archaeon]|nr:nucleotide exchange factor GrpE [Candidatus Altiarchaeota archaeon]